MADAANGKWPLVTVFGGSGFVGRHLVRALAKGERRIRVACRKPDLAGFLRPLGQVGQIQLTQANLRYPETVAAALRGADAAINLVGVLRPRGAQGFEAVHVEGAAAVAQMAREAGVATLVHMSALGADANAASLYARTKAEGEAAVLDRFPGAVVMRPSVVFGPEDNFFNRFAEMARIAPALPLIGGGATRFQPVYVGDVAQAFVAVLEGRARSGAIYELGGPRVATFRELLAFVCKTINRRRALVTVPWGGAKAAGFLTEAVAGLGLLPEWMILTRDQVELLRGDAIVSPPAAAAGLTLEGLGLDADSIEAVVPSYLWRFRKAGQYEERRLA